MLYIRKQVSQLASKLAPIWQRRDAQGINPISVLDDSKEPDQEDCEDLFDILYETIMASPMKAPGHQFCAMVLKNANEDLD